MADRDPLDMSSGQGDDDRNPLAEFMAQFGIKPGPGGTFDLEQLMGHLQDAMAQFSRQMSAMGGDDGSLNWTFAKDIARKTAAARGPDPSPDSSDIAAIADAVGLANLWLDQQTVFERGGATPVAWSRAEWIENTFPTWQRLVSPVTASMSAAIAGLIGRQAADLAGLQPMLEPMMRAASQGMLSAQIGQAVGDLSTDVVGATDIAIPVTSTNVEALLPHNIARFAEGLDHPLSDIRLYLALREAARVRLFNRVGWLGPQLHALIEHYARGISIDADAIEEALESQLQGELTPSALEEIGNTVAGTLFQPTQTDEQIEILGRLETLVALVEGWVDDVVGTTTADLMPQANALLEMVRRRRAAGGPSENALKMLLNLELRPRRVRDAANLWAAVRTARGIQSRDEVWSHPDLIPTGADLDDPLGFAEHGRRSEAPTTGDDMDAMLEELLRQERERPEDDHS